MKRQCTILSLILRDQLPDCNSKSIDRDIDTLVSRFEHEGDSFLAITLPSMCDDLMVGIQSGRWVRSRLWKEHRQGGPVFLRECLYRVFDFDNGGAVIPGEKSARALRVARQFLLFFQKVKVLPSDKKVEQAYAGFRETELALRQDRALILSALSDPLLGEVVSTLITPFLKRVQSERSTSLPRHGRGATADGSRYGRKYNTVRSYYSMRHEKSFPYDEFAFANQRHWYDSCDFFSSLVRPADELPMKVVAVPKTQKTPRLIAEEPATSQFLQQQILSALTRAIEQDPLGRLCGWTDQDRNRDLSRIASAGELATLDLSEASDRVHVFAVNLLFKDVPALRAAVLATRSTRCELPSGVIRLEKFAPMGSALCFPVESLFFTSLVVWSMAQQDHRVRSLVLTRNRKGLIKALAGRVSVYGDDIIVPVLVATQTIANLESCGLKVNSRKSFLSGLFRESCGADWFDGFDVSIVRAREPLPDGRSDHRSIQSWARVQNELYLQRYSHTARYLGDQLVSLGIREHSFNEAVKRVAANNVLVFSDLDYSEYRRCEYTHRPVIRVHKPVYDTRMARNNEWDRLHDWFLTAMGRSHETSVIAGSASFNYDRRPELVRLRSRTVAL